jgi:hypothetical protein
VLQLPPLPPAQFVGGVTLPFAPSLLSSYSDVYSAQLTEAFISADALNLTVAALGDGSLGPLQGAEHSTLIVTLPDGRELRVKPSMTEHQPQSEDVWNGTLFYPRAGDGAVVLVQGATVSWCFGESGYRAVVLFMLDEAFVEATGLGGLVGVASEEELARFSVPEPAAVLGETGEGVAEEQAEDWARMRRAATCRLGRCASAARSRGGG